MSTTLRYVARGAVSLVAVAALAGLTLGPGPVEDARAQGQGQGQQAEVYTGTFQPVGNSGVEGQVQVQRMGEQLSVRVSARNLSAGAHGQHIHEGETCKSVGGIAVPLDNSLGTLESGFGGEFPATTGESGTLTYNQTGSNPAFAKLDLENMLVVVHAGAPGGAVACAELSREGGGTGGG